MLGESQDQKIFEIQYELNHYVKFLIKEINSLKNKSLFGNLKNILNYLSNVNQKISNLKNLRYIWIYGRIHRV